MASGLTHFWISGLLAFSLFAGGVLVDIDHITTHNTKQLWSGFLGKSYLNIERNDTSHPLHTPKFYKTIFLIIACMVLFGIGYFMHLKLDGIL